MMASSVPKDKPSLIKAFLDNRVKLVKTLTELEAHNTYQPDLIMLEGQVKDTQVSVQNLLAYLLGWSEIVIMWLTNPLSFQSANESLLPEGYNFSSNSLGQLAQSFYQCYDHLSYDELKYKLWQSYEKLEDLLNQYDEHQLYGQCFYKKYTLGRMVDFNSRCPLANINSRLRKLLRQLKTSSL